MKNKLVILVISLIILLTSCSVDPDNQGSTTPPDERNYISSDVTNRRYIRNHLAREQ